MPFVHFLNSKPSVVDEYTFFEAAFRDSPFLLIPDEVEYVGVNRTRSADSLDGLFNGTSVRWVEVSLIVAFEGVL